jgi:hypothetical protein
LRDNKPCGEFHEEATCPVFLEICGGEGFSRSENEQVNMCGQRYNVGMSEWMELVEHSEDVNYMNNVVDRATEKFGPKPTPKQVSDLARYRGLTYQRNGTGNQEKTRSNVPKMPLAPPRSIFPTETELNIDLGRWLNNAKMLVPIVEIMKIPSQREKLLRAIENPPHNGFDRPPAKAHQDAPVILQNWDRGNEKNQPFFLCLLVNNYTLHNCMLDSGASSNVMTKKVMERLNLWISRPYHNICAMDN